MLIPSDLAQNAADMLRMNEYTSAPVETQEQPVLCDSEAFQPDVTAMPADVRAPFAVGGVYRFRDVYGRQREAHIYAEQWARVGQSWWHVGSIPDDATFDREFTPEPELVADARRVAREIINSERWS